EQDVCGDPDRDQDEQLDPRALHGTGRQLTREAGLAPGMTTGLKQLLNHLSLPTPPAVGGYSGVAQNNDSCTTRSAPDEPDSWVRSVTPRIDLTPSRVSGSRFAVRSSRWIRSLSSRGTYAPRA